MQTDGTIYNNVPTTKKAAGFISAFTLGMLAGKRHREMGIRPDAPFTDEYRQRCFMSGVSFERWHLRLYGKSGYDACASIDRDLLAKRLQQFETEGDMF